jgi:hypothetical protein
VNYIDQFKRPGVRDEARRLRQVKARETSLSIRAWGDEALGLFDCPARGVGRALLEFAELLEVSGHGRASDGVRYVAEGVMEKAGFGDPKRILEAMADVVIVLCRAAPGDLWAAVERKMKINRKRKWRKLPHGIGRHE